MKEKKVKEEKETKENNEEKKEKKGTSALAVIIILLLIIIGILSYFLFFDEKVTINTDGGTVVQKIEIKDEEIVTLPVIEKPGYKVVAYVNENNKILKVGSKVTKKTKITPVYVKENVETVNVTFKDGDTVIAQITLSKNSKLIVPEDQKKDNFTFGGWLYENGMPLIGYPNVDRDLVLIVNWIDSTKEIVKITVFTAEEEQVGEYKQEKGTKIILPTTPIKEGYVFENWVQLKKFVVITSETIIEEDISIKPRWAKYSCPNNCTVNSDGKTCVKTAEAKKVTKQGCPSGAFEYYGKCITLKGAGDARIRQCDGDMSGREVYYGDYCAKVVSKVTITTCPAGYSEKNNTCIKSETLNCTKVDE